MPPASADGYDTLWRSCHGGSDPCQQSGTAVEPPPTPPMTPLAVPAGPKAPESGYGMRGSDAQGVLARNSLYRVAGAASCVYDRRCILLVLIHLYFVHSVVTSLLATRRPLPALLLAMAAIGAACSGGG